MKRLTTPASSNTASHLEGANSQKNAIQSVFLAIALLTFTFTVSKTEASAPVNCTGFRTQTQGGWGANPSGNNPGVYLHANFSAAFPAGLTIGGCGNTLKLSSAQAVTDFLPSGSTPSALPAGQLLNPGGSYSNVLAGQAVTATLNIGFDVYDPLFSANALPLSGLFYNSGTFSGMTVAQVLAEANNVLGGCGSIYSAADLNAALTTFNQNYDNGNQDQHFLDCTPSVPSIPLSAVLDASTDVSCYGSNDGSASISVSGGVSPYMITWSNGASGASVANLAAGNYSATVTDHSGASVIVYVSIYQPALLVAAIQGSDVSCFGGQDGAADLSVSGGSPAYSYAWSNGASSEDISGLAAGAYSVAVTDAHGCIAHAEIVIDQPDLLVAAIHGSNVACFGGQDGAADLSVSGGSPAYSYAWSNGASSEDISGLAAGAYSVAVTDAHGCIAHAEIVITQPDLLVAAVHGSNVACFGGQDGAADLSASGGTAPYSYAWSNGASSEDISGLAAGAYSVAVTDAHGCIAHAEIAIDQPDLLVAAIHGSNVACFGGQNGAINLSVSGGTPAYNYAWSNGASSEDISGLTAGAYSVIVTDAHGCTASAQVAITQPAALAMSQIILPVSAFGAQNGAINITPTGGVPAYSYSWSNGAITEDLSGLIAGTYIITLSDANGCKLTRSIVVIQPPCSNIGLRTQTQGGWGAKPSGNNSGAYLYAKFAAAFPTGVTVGACGKTLTLTSAAAVTNFLPSGSTPRALTASLTNPTKASYSNVLAGQAITLALNIGFDQADASFGPATTLLKALVITSGPFAGWTVQAVMNEANKVLGGCPSAYNAADLNNVLTAINENYDGGLVNKGFLTCPSANKAEEESVLNKSVEAGLDAYPNPFANNLNFHFQASSNNSARVVLVDVTGKEVAVLFDGPVLSGQHYHLELASDDLAPGLYIARLSDGQRIYSKKLILAR